MMQVNEISRMGSALGPILVLAVIAIVIVGVILLVVMLSRRGGSRPSSVQAPSRPALSETELRDRRTQVLEQLAARQLTKEEAEEQLGELGSTAPPSLPPPPASTAGGRGCMVVALVGVGLLMLFLAFLGLFAMRFVSHQRTNVNHMHQQQIERVQQLQEQFMEEEER